MAVSLARYNFFISVEFLKALVARGLKHIVLCPGSRSGSLALAAASLSKRNELTLITSIDERSAAFLALGISAASGQLTGVITTSGSAVANLLPAAVEADRSCHPVMFLTADRPSRLKECGANQSVNQQDFLKSVCRYFDESPREGIHLITRERLEKLVDKSYKMAIKFPGPVHINIAYDEPLHPSLDDQQRVLNGWQIDGFSVNKQIIKESESINQIFDHSFKKLDPFKEGIIIVGPYRGKANQLSSFRKALHRWHTITGWPILADPLAGIKNDQKGLIFHWELLFSSGFFSSINEIQVLRLGPMPTSRELNSWLEKPGKLQLIISEGDYRNLDPVGRATQFSDGLFIWVKNNLDIMQNGRVKKQKTTIKNLTSKLIELDLFINSWLDKKILSLEKVTEPGLARWLPRLLPNSIPVMLASSSPIRDWMIFSGQRALSRRCYGFRGASGIDGTLSLAMGLSIVMGRMILITGDLAMLHDTNGWLFSNNKNTSIIVILIDNGGGGIFNQLNIEHNQEEEFEQIFIMPQEVCPLTLVKAYGVKYTQVACIDDLERAIEWSLSLSTNVLIRVCTNSHEDHKLRVSLRDDLKRTLFEQL